MIPILFINKSRFASANLKSNPDGSMPKKKGKPLVIKLSNKSPNVIQYAQPPFTIVTSITDSTIVLDATGKTILEINNYSHIPVLNILQRQVTLVHQSIQPIREEYFDVVCRMEMIEDNYDNQLDLLQNHPTYQALRRKFFELRDIVVINENRLRALHFLIDREMPF